MIKKSVPSITLAANTTNAESISYPDGSVWVEPLYRKAPLPSAVFKASCLSALSYHTSLQVADMHKFSLNESQIALPSTRGDKSRLATSEIRVASLIQSSWNVKMIHTSVGIPKMCPDKDVRHGLVSLFCCSCLRPCCAAKAHWFY